MIRVLTVCTGNLCRSPLAAQLLERSHGDDGTVFSSAGLRARNGDAMPPDAQRLAVSMDIDPALAAQHRSRYLLEAHLVDPDLILAMTREHRRDIVELAPRRLRTTFTIREFARLSADLGDDELRARARSAGADHRVRMASILDLLSSRRGVVSPPATPDSDDVVDPFRRSWDTYLRSGAQLAPAVDEVARVLWCVREA